MAHRQQIYTHGQASDYRSQQWRLIGRCLHGSATQLVQGRCLRRTRHRHVALPQIHRRSFLDTRIGDAETNAEHFKFLYAYSPLHNVKEGVSYPPTLVQTADTDDRVVPAHAKKFAATLQAAHAGDNPILVRIETKAGHGLGKPTTKVIEDQRDMYTFLFKVLNVDA